MNKISVLTGLFLFSWFFSTAQLAPGIQWQKNYGGTNSEYCQFSALTFDGGYILGGNTESTNGDVTVNHGNADWWIIKTNALGVKQWQKSYGGSALDFLNQVKPDINGGYMLVGYTYSNDGDVTGNHGGGDAWIVKIDDTGRIVWQKVMGTSGMDFFYSINNTPDSGYIAAGMASGSGGDVTGSTYHGNGDLWVVKFDKTGAINWKQCYGGSQQEYAYDGKVTQDHGYIFCGAITSSDGIVNNYHGGGDAWILKLDSVGVVQWNKCYGGDSADFAESIIQKPNGNYLCAINTKSINGEVTGNHGIYDYWIVETDDTGKINWSKCYGGSNWDVVYWIIPTYDSGYAISGTTYSSDGDVIGKHGISSDSGDYWVVKINDTGKIMWTKCLGGIKDDGAAQIMQSADSCIVISGFTSSNDGDVTTNYGGYDYWLVKLNKETPVKISVVTARPDINVYPTLTTGLVHIEMPQGYENASIILIDITGKQIDSKITEKGCSRTLQLCNLEEGMYFLNIINNNEMNSFKLIYHP